MTNTNPSHSGCPSDIAQIQTTDYRPSKALYVDVKDSNKFRAFLQHNGNSIRKAQLKKFENSQRCCQCEYQPKQIVPFSSDFTCHQSVQEFWPGFERQQKSYNITGYKN